MFIPHMKRITYLCAIGLGATHLSRLVRHKIYKQYVQVLFGHRVVNTSEPLYTFLRQLGFSTLEEFDRRIQYLSKHYTPISIDECAEYLDGRKVASSSMIALTFDDGYRSIYTHIFPLLKKYHIPAMVFLTTDCLSKNCILVNDRLLYIIGATRVTQFALPELGPETYSLAGESQRVQVYTEISARLKRIPNGEKVAIIEKLSEVLPVERERTETEHTDAFLARNSRDAGFRACNLRRPHRFTSDPEQGPDRGSEARAPSFQVDHRRTTESSCKVPGLSQRNSRRLQ